ncbi:MAG: general secretion pathway protein GspB [Povalibacter sp.]
MSFILDALKKSENERQRTIGPSLADAPVRRQQSERPWWAIAIAALLVVNLGVLVVALARHSKSAAVSAPAPVVNAAPTPSQAAPRPERAQPAPTRPATSNPAVRSLAEEADSSYGPYDDGTASSDAQSYGDEHPDLSAAATVPDGPPMVRPVAPPAVAPVGSTTNDAEDSSGSTEETLPTATALIGSGIPLPDMRLDIHVYSNIPTDRFVFINMHKYSEGQVIAEGATLERVTPQGAILDYQGTRFLLPRQ